MAVLVIPASPQYTASAKPYLHFELPDSCGHMAAAPRRVLCVLSELNSAAHLPLIRVRDGGTVVLVSQTVGVRVLSGTYFPGATKCSSFAPRM
jgi:hypothetical protein